MTDTARSLPWITKLVSIDTTSRDSNLPLIDEVAAHLRAHGVEPEIFPDETGAKANLVATIPAADGTRTGGVVLSGHTDVVPVDGQEWSSEPFDAQVRDGRLYGRGTCDMKAFAGVALTLLPEMLEATLSEPIHLAFTYDEEVGCLGGEHIVKQIADLGLAPRACIVGEPTSMRVVHGHKSGNQTRVTFRGVAAHSSLTNQGVNAIEHAATFITFVRSVADEWKNEGPFDDAYPVSYSTVSVNMVNGGIATNTVPELCTVAFDFRTVGAVDADETLERFRAEAARIERLMKAEDERASVDFTSLAVIPGLESAADGEAARLALALGALANDGKVTYGTEAGQFSGSGIDTIVCGPGDIAQAHAADEYVELEQITRCEEFLTQLIASLDTRAGRGESA